MTWRRGLFGMNAKLLFACRKQKPFRFHLSYNTVKRKQLAQKTEQTIVLHYTLYSSFVWTQQGQQQNRLTIQWAKGKKINAAWIHWLAVLHVWRIFFPPVVGIIRKDHNYFYKQWYTINKLTVRNKCFGQQVSLSQPQLQLCASAFIIVSLLSCRPQIRRSVIWARIKEPKSHEWVRARHCFQCVNVSVNGWLLTCVHY